MKNKDFFLVNHIPKCAGTSFKYSLIKNYGEEVLDLSYNPIRKGFYENAKLTYTKISIKYFRKKLFEGKKFVHGHFCFDDIPFLKDYNIFKLCFFRDPIDWFGSYYFWVKNFRKIDVKDPITFLKNYNLYNGFKIHLGNTQIKDLDFVGIVEKYSESINILNKKFNLKISFNELNKNYESINYDYSEKLSRITDIKKLKNLLKNNYEIYIEAKEKFNSQIIDN